MTDPMTFDLSCSAGWLALSLVCGRRCADPLQLGRGVLVRRDDALPGMTVAVGGDTLRCSPRAFALFAEEAVRLGLGTDHTIDSN